LTPPTGVAVRDNAELHILAISGEARVDSLLDRSTRHGIRSDRVGGCDEALARLRTCDYDVIVVAATADRDLVHLCNCLHEGGTRGPILAIAVGAAPHTVVAALNASADGCLAGPIADAEFVARLHAARRRHEYDRVDRRPSGR
jgi:DNA-binding response OmpR family regulator